METVISALNSKSRRHILRVLSKYFGYPSDALTVKELISELSQDANFSVRHRESIYKALEILVKSGLVEKYYEKERGMCYRVVKKKLEIDLANGRIE
ncbi:MAG: hypothetical protein ACFE8U_16650 [Candidatus Hermodarchaeota archaeon]